MTDTTQTQDLLAALQAQLAAQLAATQKQATSGWNTPTATTTPIGVAIPIKVSTPKGEIRLYLQMGPEHAASPEAIIQTLQALDAQGYPLDVWQPKSDGWGSGGSGWNRSGGYNRRGWQR